MSTVKLSELNQFILPEVAGCPIQTVTNAIRNALIEFCERARAWRYTMDPIRVKANQATYELDSPSGSRIVTLVFVAHNGYPLTHKTEDQLDLEWPKLNYAYAERNHYSETGTPWRQVKDSQATFYYMPDRKSIRLVAIPDTTKSDALEIKAALKPLPTVTEMDEDLFNDYYESLAAGAKHRLMKQPGKQWSDPNNSAVNFSDFEKGIAKAKGDRYTDYADNDSAVGRSRVQD